MVRLMERDTDTPKGDLIVEEVHSDCVEVYYVPEKEKLSQSGLDPDNRGNYRVKLLVVDGQNNSVTIYPVNTLGGHMNFLCPKYGKVTCITLSGFDFLTPYNYEDVLHLLEDFPRGLIKDYDYGLGLSKDYRFIVFAIESLSDCTEVKIAFDVATGIDKDDGDVFNISYRDFEEARKFVDSITRRVQETARSIKGTGVFNLFAVLTGEKEEPVALGKHTVNRLVAQAIYDGEHLTEADQEAILNTLSKNTKEIAEAKPEKLAKLQNEIELVTLEVLIDRYTAMLSQKLKEDQWQTFFNENPFILSLAFGYPVIKVRGQASIGGHKITGSGEKITDFLVKNSLTNNTALFEIKTPQAHLLSKRPYREGVFTPSHELSGSINQALDQKYQFQKQIAQIKETSRIYDIESYAVHSCVIIGLTPAGIDQQKSFELFRRNSKDVQIVTFDELLEKLRQLHRFLVSSEGDMST